MQKDLTEKGPRAWLNLGHTFGHALESITGLGEHTHGQAVAWGMARAMDLGRRLGVTAPAWAARLTALLEAYGFTTRVDGVDASALLEAMGRDKKKRGAGLRFVLQEDLCRTLVREVDASDVTAVIG